MFHAASIILLLLITTFIANARFLHQPRVRQLQQQIAHSNSIRSTKLTPLDISKPIILQNFITDDEIHQLRFMLNYYHPQSADKTKPYHHQGMPHRNIFLPNGMSCNQACYTIFDTITSRITSYVNEHVNANISSWPHNGTVWPSMFGLYRHEPNVSFHTHVDTDQAGRCISTSLALTDDSVDHHGGRLQLHGCYHDEECRFTTMRQFQDYYHVFDDERMHYQSDPNSVDCDKTITQQPQGTLDYYQKCGWRTWEKDIFPPNVQVSSKKGTLTMFLSEQVHSVTKIESGTREVFLLWLNCDAEIGKHKLRLNRYVTEGRDGQARGVVNGGGAVTRKKEKSGYGRQFSEL